MTRLTNGGFLAAAAAAGGPNSAQAWKEAGRLVLVWVLITLVALAVAIVAVRPSGCESVEECSKHVVDNGNFLSGYFLCALITSLAIEVMALCITWTSARPLVGMVRGIEFTFVPPCCLCVAFVVLIFENICVANGWLVHSAANGVGGPDAVGRPVYSAITFEWLVNVPLLLVLSGNCALNRPLLEVSRPLIVTNLYIVLAWAAHFVANARARWSCIAVAFAMWGWASVDMVRWVLAFLAATTREFPARGLRCRLTIGLVVVFLVYGLLYLAGELGLFPPHKELFIYIAMNVLVKLTILLTFVGIRSSSFFDLLVNLLLNKRTVFERQIAVSDDFASFDHSSTLPLLM